MASVKKMVALRNSIDDLIYDNLRKQSGGVLSSDELLREVKRRLDSQIVAAAPDLIDIGLKQVIDSVGRRKAGRRREPGEKDLFGEYPNIPQTLIVGNKKRKSTARIPIDEEVDYLEAHSPKAVSERHDALKRLVNDLLPFRETGKETIEELIERKKQALSGEAESVFHWASPYASKEIETHTLPV